MLQWFTIYEVFVPDSGPLETGRSGGWCSTTMDGGGQKSQEEFFMMYSLDPDKIGLAKTEITLE